MRGFARSSLLGAGAALLFTASRCAAPTAIAVDVYTDLPCDAGPVAIVAGAGRLAELVGVDASAASVTCDRSSGRLGRLVLLPRASERVAFTVATRAGGGAEACLAGVPAKGCIVARRELRFIDRTTLEMRVDLRTICADVACPATQTCVRGACVDAVVRACTQGCTESDLAPDTPATGPPFWRTVSPMGVARMYAGAATDGEGRIHVVGGFVGATPLDAHEVYDALADTWTNGPALPAANGAMAAVAGPDGRVYLFGGRRLREALALTPGASAWATLPLLPTGRSYTRAATAPDGRIVVIGGDNLAGTPNLSAVEAFDPNTSTWSTLAPMPTGRGNLGVSTGPDGRIYAFGGDAVDSGPGPVYDVAEALDAPANTWTSVRRLPEPASGLYAALGPDGRIYVVSGGRALAYDATRDAWDGVASLASGHTAGAVARGPDDRIYVFGGAVASGAESVVVEAYGPVLSVSPSGAPSGATVTIEGSNFAAFSTVGIYLDDTTGAPLATARADVDGKLPAPVTITIPAVPKGPHAIVVRDDRSRYPVRKPFFVP